MYQQNARAIRAAAQANISKEAQPTGWRGKLANIDWTPDLGQNIGSGDWFRGLATMVSLAAVSLFFWPGFEPIRAEPATRMSAAQLDEFRALAIAPLAYGGDTGRKMRATDAVIALKESPERPSIDLAATFGRGDSFARVLQRAGVGGDEASNIENMLAGVMSLSDLKPGTQLDITLGRRTSRDEPRPVENIAFRAKFDLNVEIARQGEGLALKQKPIIVDETPLRIRGKVGSSLYRSARAAGAPAKAIQAYLRALGTKMSVSRDVRSTDEFDIVLGYKRAETGEIEVGDLMYAGLDRGGKSKAQLLRWKSGGKTQWFEASGVGESRGELARPVRGRVSSRYGMRRHPILKYRRMHSGLDFKARHGEPIYAATDGVVQYAGRKGGFGKYVKIRHGGGLASGYAHMSRIAVSSGRRVRRGQIIGYVGSTGLSTGPHLHYELYRGGRTINPQSVRFTTRAQLSGSDLRNFKAKLARLKRVEPGAALRSITKAEEVKEPVREIERIEASSS
ncbi:M23 family metallopeptidase [Sphingorhabdus sp. Alg239-R122]|uniref:M23 family metallopeptidase n=1 Tax=Sphingorhabdus sp. Alg239-R122 TaxID=2305989 RepID=UPI001F07D0D9|nr:M23 family metallopeptidase [Sphingorhabdus sp. Alg239-R122]